MSRGGPIVALSVSDGPDLPRFGYLDHHLRQVLNALLIELLRGDLRIGYGGDLRRSGYTRELFDALTAAYAKSRLVADGWPAIVHYFAYSSWCDVDPAELLDHLALLGTVAETRFVDVAGEYLAVFSTEDGLRRIVSPAGDSHAMGADELVGELASIRARSGTPSAGDALAAMRRTMAGETILRVVASGKVAGYQGRMPGIVEEALLHAEAGRLIVALGAFGGAARDAAIALGLLDEDARVSHTEVGAGYDAALAELCGLAGMHRERAEEVGTWADLQMLSEADDPMAIATGVVRIAGRTGSPDALACGLTPTLLPSR
ncbi:MAG: hypothetical protein IPK66_18265 [Rhodospirillales bacterium]|nr:hypothetical protein [Rhodospirillales bacterium]